MLDDDDFPDIATSNRQGLDEHDGRVTLLKDILAPIIRSLIDKRSELAQEMKRQQKEITDKRAGNAKAQFSKEISAELDRYEQLTSNDKTELKTIIANKIQGDVQPKDNYLVFFSHSRFDKIFADFIYNVLLLQGVDKKEIFYTSRDDNPEKYADISPLRDIIHKCVTNMNNMLFYLVGPKYKSSEFCMFEGGAGWATRSVGDYPVMAIKYEHIPKFLTNGKNEFAICDDGKISLERENYIVIVALLNRLIEHINSGRKIRSAAEVPLILETTLPSKLELYERKELEEQQQYMNKNILKCWKCFVEPNLSDYIKALQ